MSGSGGFSDLARVMEDVLLAQKRILSLLEDVLRELRGGGPWNS
ncbi:MAG: hypothetical protein ACR2LG_04900 [Actinomycetota bacterium]